MIRKTLRKDKESFMISLAHTLTSITKFQDIPVIHITVLRWKYAAILIFTSGNILMKPVDDKASIIAAIRTYGVGSLLMRRFLDGSLTLGCK
jgi:hypothetical protein